MSVNNHLVGLAPKVYFNENVGTASISDDQAVHLLLNDTSESLWTNTKLNLSTSTVSGLPAPIGASIALSTSSNKSLVVVQGSNNPPGNAVLSADGMTFDPTQSTVVNTEQLRYRLDAPNNGAYSFDPNESSLSFTENAATSQGDLDAQRVFRYSVGSAYLVSRGNNRTLGHEGLIVTDAGNYDAANMGNLIQPDGTLASNNITLSVNRSSNDAGSYTYDAYRLHWNEATFEVGADAATVVKFANNNAISQPSSTTYNYTDLIDVNTYTGGYMTQSAFNNVDSTTVTIQVDPAFAGATGAFTASNTNGSELTLTNNTVDISYLDPQTVPSGNLTAVLDPTDSVVADEPQNSALSVDIPAGGEIGMNGVVNGIDLSRSQASVTFDSSDRVTKTVDIMGATVNVVYSADGVNDTEAVNGMVGVLSNASMTTENVSSSVVLTSRSTTSADNIAEISAVNSNNMAFHLDGAGSLSVSGVDSNSNNVFGFVQPYTTVVPLSESADDHLLKPLGGVITDNLELATYTNTIHGSDLSGNIALPLVQSDASAGLRVSLAPIDPHSGASFVVSDLATAKVLISNSGNANDVKIVKKRGDGLTVYDLNNDTQGPMKLHNMPTSGVFKHKYTLKFPEDGQAMYYNATQSGVFVPIGAATNVGYESAPGPFGGPYIGGAMTSGPETYYNVVLPESVEVRAQDASGSDISEKVVTIPIVATGSGKNIVGIAADPSYAGPGNMYVSAKLQIPLLLPGIVDSSAHLEMNITYVYTRSGGSYQNGPKWYTSGSLGSALATFGGVSAAQLVGRPEGHCTVSLDAEKLVNTHRVTLQGSNNATSITDGDWTDLGTQTEQLVDLRRDIPNLSLVSGVSNSDFDVSVVIRPNTTKSAPSFYSVQYVLGANLTGGGWQGYYASFDDSIAALAANPALDLASVKAIVQAVGSSNMTSLTMAASASGGVTTVSASAGVSFQASVDTADIHPIYFARLTKALISIGSSNLLVSNGDLITLFDGVSVAFSGIQGSSANGVTVLDMSLNKDQYSAISYPGQTGKPYNTLGLIPSNKQLIPKGSDGSKTIFGINTSIYRGFQNGTTHTFTRCGLELTVTWGALTETLCVNTPDGSVTTAVFNMGNSLNLSFDINTQPASVTTYTFEPNNAKLTVKRDGSTKINNVSVTSLDFSAYTGSANVPFLDLFKLSNFYVNASSTVTINYVQDSIHLSNYGNYVVSNVSVTDAGDNSWTEIQAKSDAQLAISNTFVQTNLTFTVTNRGRRGLAKRFFVTVAPTYFLAVFPDSGTANNTFALTSTSTTYNLAYHTLTVNTASPSTLLAGAYAADLYFILSKEPLLLTIEGKQGSLPAVTYVNQQPITSGDAYENGTANQFQFSFEQANTSNTAAEELLTVYFDDYTTLSSLYTNDGWSGYVDVLNTTVVFLTQYILQFEMNATTKAMTPVVLKLVSNTYDPNNLGASGVDNIDGSGGTKDGFGGHLKQFNTDTAYKCVLTDLRNRLDAPCMSTYLTATLGITADYPTTSSANNTLVHALTGLVFDQIANDSAEFPPRLDLVVNVKDYAISSTGVKTENTTGTDKYQQLLTANPGRRKIINMYAPDQLVVKNFVGKLSMRVGPDGQLYTGDMVAYSVLLRDNQSSSDLGAINKQVAPLRNSDLNLSSNFPALLGIGVPV